ncbi:uncharacterized protein LOC123710370 [Pieris brassicae]|uniref:uncharacterized protein LOC123710370 n=1 Tax=Pieris brassicae TaxID=7116 RepID=UPI001E661CDC|nr:uncharacterized protein LOC123710370 [Pieris brassicae]
MQYESVNSARAQRWWCDFRMSPAASFGERWALDNLTRKASPEELLTLELILNCCSGDEAEASKRARKYYTARGPGGLTELWHRRRPDDDDILSSCQDVYIVPLRTRSAEGRRLTFVKLPAPTALNKPLTPKALLARWLMILDIRLKDDPTPGDEVVMIDVCDLQPAHLKSHFKGSYWKDFAWCMKSAYPHRFSEIHIINTQKLKTISVLLLHMSLYPWRRIIRSHPGEDGINNFMDDYFPPEGLPHEYGGKAGVMKDLNDEWTKKLLLNSKWLRIEEQKFYQTELKPDKRRQNRSLRNLLSISSYDISRSQSCKSLDNELEEGPYGAYRSLSIDKTFYI